MFPHAHATRSSHQRHRHRLIYCLVAAASTALIALVTGASPGAAAYGTPPKAAPKPVNLTVLSPGTSDVAGQDGAGFVVDLALTARNKSANALLSPEAGYKPFFNN